MAIIILILLILTTINSNKKVAYHQQKGGGKVTIIKGPITLRNTLQESFKLPKSLNRTLLLNS